MPFAVLSVYPNPTYGMLYIVAGNNFGSEFFIDVISSLGRTVLSQKRECLEGEKCGIDLGGLPKGIYLIQIRSAKSRVVQKVMVM